MITDERATTPHETSSAAARLRRMAQLILFFLFTDESTSFHCFGLV